MDPVRVVVAGCGLVVERHHLPAYASLADDVEVVGLVDPNPAQRERCRALAPGATPFDHLEDALRVLSPDLVLVASPAAFHLEQTLMSFAAGAHVLCEKPLALTGAACQEMVQAAEGSGRLLAVGLMRRFLPSVQAIASIISNRVLGAPVSFAILEGVSFSWPVTSPHPFERGRGGGVLFDAGPHLIDLLQFWLGELDLVDYVDDAMGGVEVNCTLQLAASGATGSVRLSRELPLPQRHVIHCERGWVAYHYEVADRFYWGWDGSPTANCVMLSTPPSDRPMWDWPDPRLRVPTGVAVAFEAQHRNVLDAIRGTARLVVQPREAAAGIALLENCHRARRLMPMPWMDPAEWSRAEQLEREVVA